MAMRILQTSSEVIDALEGPTEVARLLGLEDARVPHNWKSRGIPGKYTLAILAALEARGCTAPASVLGQKGPFESLAADEVA